MIHSKTSKNILEIFIMITYKIVMTEMNEDFMFYDLLLLEVFTVLEIF